ncbi:DMT family transporter [Hartmannibacter diazotrophicus]|nr:DMT family transporter [Hartmannibacter diazotrophicus]
MAQTFLLTTIAMIAFAGNSLLARTALADGEIDAASYTAIRLISGGILLLALLMRDRRSTPLRDMPGDWVSTFALFAYALAFSLAYLRLGAATGALILFASVQGTMISWAFFGGDRPTPVEMIGLTAAFLAFIYLVLPGLSAPDPLGSALMMVSGISWGVYTLKGRGTKAPLNQTAGNFIRSIPLCLPLLAIGLLMHRPSWHGVLLALASGAIASGLGYAIWYRTLPHLSTAKAAVVQLTVPVIAAFGAVALLGEALTPRFLTTSVVILGGVALAISAKTRRAA